MKTADLYKSVTNRIITELKEGVPPWAKPWKDGSRGLTSLPVNATSGRMYSGINVLILYMEAKEKGYPTHGWATFQQANQIGASVRKGEKATQVVFVKRTTREPEKEGDEPKTSTVMKAYSVFNLAQLDNVPPQYVEQEPPRDQEVIYDQAFELQKNWSVRVSHGGNIAAYYPQRDEIVMPTFGSFDDEGAYWGVYAHEAIHSTGHKDRLNRNFGKRFKSHARAIEELTAELGSAFTCARLGIPATFRSAAYIESWLKVLGEDPTAIFTAASYASQAANLLWETAFYAETETTPEVERAKAPEPVNDMEDAIPY